MDGLVQGGIQAIQEIKKGSGSEALEAVPAHDFVAASSVHDPQQMWRPLENPAALVDVPVACPAKSDEVVLAQHLGLPATTHAPWHDVVAVKVLCLLAYLAGFHAFFISGYASYGQRKGVLIATHMLRNYVLSIDNIRRYVKRQQCGECGYSWLGRKVDVAGRHVQRLCELPTRTRPGTALASFRVQDCVYCHASHASQVTLT